MWRMLTGQARDLRVELGDHAADPTARTGRADWTARYTFTQTGRPVVNRVHATLPVRRDGLHRRARRRVLLPRLGAAGARHPGAPARLDAGAARRGAASRAREPGTLHDVVVVHSGRRVGCRTDRSRSRARPHWWLALGLGAGAAEAAKKPRKRDVLVVSNNWAGTADLVDPHTFKRLKRLDVVPGQGARIAEIRTDPTATFYYDSIRALVGEGHDQYVDDGFVSRDGRVVYFSRPSFADVVAIDIRTRRDPLAHPRRRLPRRPHGALARRPAAARLRLDRARGRRARHRGRRDPRQDPLRRLPAREQLLARRQRRSSTRASARSTPTRTTRRRTRRRASASSRSSTRTRSRSPGRIDMGAKLAEFGPARA